MKINSASITLAVLGFGLGVHSLPQSSTKRDDAPAPLNDTTVLNVALALEHLESAFYHQGLAKYSEQAFLDAGFPSFVRGRISQLAEHEATHVDFLSTALGSDATKPCTYDFPHTDPKSFIAVSRALEGVGVSAYAGAAQLISSKASLTVAASILATEARHASWIASAVDKGSAWSGAFDVPLSLKQVLTLASAFITSCPASNPPFPVAPFPALSVAPSAGSSKSTAAPGSSVTFAFNATGVAPNTTLYAVYFTGLSKVFAPLEDNGQTTVPQNLTGTVYAAVSKNGTGAGDEDIVAGPAQLLFEFNSAGSFVA